MAHVCLHYPGCSIPPGALLLWEICGTHFRTQVRARWKWIGLDQCWGRHYRTQSCYAHFLILKQFDDHHLWLLTMASRHKYGIWGVLQIILQYHRCDIHFDDFFGEHPAGIPTLTWPKSNYVRAVRKHHKSIEKPRSHLLVHGIHKGKLLHESYWCDSSFDWQHLRGYLWHQIFHCCNAYLDSCFLEHLLYHWTELGRLW